VNFFGGWGDSGDEEDDNVKPLGASQGPTGEQDVHQAAQDDDSSVDSTSVLVHEAFKARVPIASLDAVGSMRLVEKVSTAV